MERMKRDVNMRGGEKRQEEKRKSCKKALERAVKNFLRDESRHCVMCQAWGAGLTHVKVF